MKLSGAVRVPCKDLSALFRSWVEFLKPIHHLTDRLMDVLASYLRQRYELSKKISDPAILDREVMSSYTELEVIKDCKMTKSYFEVIRGKLRTLDIISKDRINPKFIPIIIEEDNSVRLLVMFTLPK